MPVRKIIKIDEEKCTGCGLCVIDCAEGALQILDGKARVIKDSFCDGLGACLGACPEGALEIIEREADEFDEKAVEAHLAHKAANPAETMACGCAGSMVQVLQPASQSNESVANSSTDDRGPAASELSQWPIQLRLMPPSGVFYNDKKVVLVADCVAAAFPDLHRKLIRGNTIILTCPKLDKMDESIQRLAAIFENPIKQITCAIMEVPCCSGLLHLTKEALKKSGNEIPLNFIKIGIKGQILEEGTG